MNNIAELNRKIDSLSAMISGRQTDPQAAAKRLLESWLNGRNENTVKNYSVDLDHLKTFVNAKDQIEAIAHVLACDHGECAELLQRFQRSQLKAEYAPATVNRRMSVLSALLKHGRSLGLTTLEPEIKRLKDELTKSTEGPSVEKILQVLADLKRIGEGQNRKAASSLRDRALISVLFFGGGLRIGDAITLRSEDVLPDCSAINVLAKGRTQRQQIKLPDTAQDALKDWMKRRGNVDGWVFCSCKNGFMNVGSALDRHTAWQRVHDLGLIRPHGLRHTAAVEALRLTGGNLEAVRLMLRHSSVITTQRYLTTSRDTARDTTELLNAHVTGRPIPETAKPIAPKQPEPYQPITPKNAAAAAREILKVFLSGISEVTASHYKDELAHFKKWLNLDGSLEILVEYFLSLDQIALRELVTSYRDDQLKRCKPETINGRIQNLQRLFRIGQELRHTDLTIDFYALPKIVAEKS